MKLIGLTGLNASGKGTLAEILVKGGYEYFSLSDIVREYATEVGLDHSRENLIYCGNKLRELYGPSVLAKKVIEKIIRQPAEQKIEKAIVDSIRNIYEIEELRKVPGFLLIGVDAPAEVRFERAKIRERVGFEKTLEDFINVEKKENSSDPSKQQLFECLKMADKVIINDGTKDELILKARSLS